MLNFSLWANRDCAPLTLKKKPLFHLPTVIMVTNTLPRTSRALTKCFHEERRLVLGLSSIILSPRFLLVCCSLEVSNQCFLCLNLQKVGISIVSSQYWCPNTMLFDDDGDDDAPKMLIFSCYSLIFLFVSLFFHI